MSGLAGTHQAPGEDSELGDLGNGHRTDDGRAYLVGFPVVVLVHDDGTISLEVCAEDIVEAIADFDDDEITNARQEQANRDSVTAGIAYEQNLIRTITVNNSKGA